MDHLDRAHLVALASLEGSPAISIFLPLEGGGSAGRQDPIRAKNLLRRAAADTAARGFDADVVAGVLAPLEALAADPAFWSGPAGGQAFYAAPGFSRGVRLDYPVDERVEVGERFVVKPLLQMLDEPALYYVLALSLNHVRLLEATSAGVRRIASPDLPKSFAAMGYVEYESSVQVHSGSKANLGRRGIFSGHGDSDEEHFKEDVQAFFRRVAAAVEHALPNPEAPLVLAAVAPHHALFARVKDRLRVPADGVFGNPDDLGDSDLAGRGREIVGAFLERQRDVELERWEELRGNGRGLDDFEEIVGAADQGRVEVLFLAREIERRGTYEPDLARVQVHERPEPGDVDLVELAASRTLAQGGRVHVLPRDAMPGGRVVVATLRYAIAA